MAQQRTSGLRRNRTNLYGVQFANLDWIWDGNAGDEVYFSLYLAGPSMIMNTDGLTLNGVPPMVDLNTMATAIAAHLTPTQLVLDFGYPQGAGSSFYMPVNTPQFRGEFGEFLGCKQLVVPAPAPGPADIVITAVGSATNTVTLYAFTGAAGLAMRNLPVITNDTNAQNATSVTTDGNSIVATFASTVNLGDSISWAGGTTDWLNDTLGGLTAGSIVVP